MRTILRAHKGASGKDHVWSSTRGNPSGKIWGSGAHKHLQETATQDQLPSKYKGPYPVILATVTAVNVQEIENCSNLSK
jgi:hypothetical protein